MMDCEKCWQPTSVVDSRGDKNGTTYRRRKCLACGHRFSTYEVTRATIDQMLGVQKELDNLKAIMADAFRKTAEPPPAPRAMLTLLAKRK